MRFINYQHHFSLEVSAIPQIHSATLTP